MNGKMKCLSILSSNNHSPSAYKRQVRTKAKVRYSDLQVPHLEIYCSARETLFAGFIVVRHVLQVLYSTKRAKAVSDLAFRGCSEGQPPSGHFVQVSTTRKPSRSDLNNSKAISSRGPLGH